MTPWILFHTVVFAGILVEMSALRRSNNTEKSSLKWLSFWVGIAAVFNLLILMTQGAQPALEFLNIYLVEGTLSVDNVFLFIVLFERFSIPKNLYRHVLLYGVVGAILMRGLFISVGVNLVEAFQWVTYVFGGMLLWAAAYLLKQHKKEDILPKWFYAMQKYLPFTKEFEGKRFMVRREGRLFFTPLFMVVLAIEGIDLIFAFDSIPAALALSQDKYIIYTANILSVMMLRSLFFIVAPLMDRIYYLKYALSFILLFMGVKTLMGSFYEVSPGVSLMVIVSGIGVSILASLRRT